jgi:hypothetical protein
MRALGFAHETISARQCRGGLLRHSGFLPGPSSGRHGVAVVRMVPLPPNQRSCRLWVNTLSRWLLFGWILVDWQGRSVLAQTACVTTCGGESDQSCLQSKFSACAVTCDSATSSSSSSSSSSSNSTSSTAKDTTCSGATFDDASAVTCAGGGGVCAYAQFLDQTSATCEGAETCRQVTARSSSVTCSGAGEAGTSAANANATTTCQAMSATSSTVTCEEGACARSQFVDSTVSCQQGCTSSNMTRGVVSCLDASCTFTNFVVSAVACDDSSSCVGATFDSCSCCDGYGCSAGLPSCKTVHKLPSNSQVSPAVSFCTMCTGQGHPLCKGGTSDSGSASVGTVVVFCLLSLVFQV